ncbi:hypothetical protein HPB50_023417 [Hyalomma asiaticum]|uniref:Uncharacterized protein n=1 Tax=Hyalomma asiaticum TaxID=266040 RepID=A0ACB7S5V2_HYAAI|nr:hypothetical protein HPB50_023417 [Hyalomma asiaticum]
MDRWSMTDGREVPRNYTRPKMERPQLEGKSADVLLRMSVSAHAKQRWNASCQRDDTHPGSREACRAEFQGTARLELCSVWVSRLSVLSPSTCHGSPSTRSREEAGASSVGAGNKKSRARDKCAIDTPQTSSGVNERTRHVICLHASLPADVVVVGDPTQGGAAKQSDAGTSRAVLPAGCMRCMH